MSRISQIAALLITLTFIICTAEARAQAFLNPVTAQAPTFLENGAASSTGATGNENNSDNLMTGPGAFKAGVVGGRALNVQSAQEGLLAPNSVNMAAFPSGSYSYGFTTSPTPTSYGGRSLPVCSTGSVDLNIVNCPNLLTNYGAIVNDTYVAGTTTNPYGLATMLDNPTNPNVPIDFQETAAEAAQFVQETNGVAFSQ